MRYNTFKFHDKEYPLNYYVVFKNNKSFVTNDVVRVKIIDHWTDSYGNEKWKYVYTTKINNDIIYVSNNHPDNELETVICRAESSNEYYKDNESEEVKIGWFVFIVLLIVSAVFKHFVGVWVIESICFYNWRKNKLCKANYDYTKYQKR